MATVNQSNQLYEEHIANSHTPGSSDEEKGPGLGERKDPREDVLDGERGEKGVESDDIDIQGVCRVELWGRNHCADTSDEPLKKLY